MSSVGETTAAESIAKKFHLRHIAGGDMLKVMAYERGYTPSGPDWWDTKEGMTFLSERERNPDFDREVDRRLANFLKKGKVVITSYPVPWICEGGLKLWFHATQRTRAKRLAGRDKIALKKALGIIKKRDSENKKLYKKLYKIRFGEDLTPFNFIIDTEKMSSAAVSGAARKLVAEYARNKDRVEV
jgi:CMP/dCMP kinase